MPIIFDIPSWLVPLRVGPIFIMRVWGTEGYHPRRTLETSKHVGRNFCLCRLCGDAHHSRPPSLTLTRRPIIVNLA